MKLANLLVLLALLGLASCSGSKKKNSNDATEVAKQENDLEEADFIVDSDEDDLLAEDSGEEFVEEVADEAAEEIAEVSEDAQEYVEQAAPVIDGGDGEYTLQKGETLMFAAFKLFGDYSKWKELKRNNMEALQNGAKEGVVLKYTPNGFAWNPKGNPHLIKRGETLGTISKDKYGTQRQWKSIWKNNIHMIKDPNLIFAGFTLYYLNKRDLASLKK